MIPKLKLAVLATVSTLTLAGCAAPPKSESGKTAGAKVPSGFKACMVSDQGGFDGKSFNESGMEGSKRAEQELSVKIGFTESKTPEDFRPNVDSLVARKCSLIIRVGFMLNEGVHDTAKTHPEINFTLVNTRFMENDKVAEMKNAKPLVFNMAEAAYLTGYISTATSKSGTASAYDGVQIPSVNIFMDGSVDDIEKYNGDNDKSVKLIGWDKDTQNGSFVGNFEDQSKGKRLTEQQVSQGSDLVMPVAGPIGQSTLAAIEDKDTKVVGVDSDWALKYPDQSKQILTSIVKGIGQAVFDTVKEAEEGRSTSEAYVDDLKNKGVDIAPFHDLNSAVPADVKERLETLKKDIIDGKIKVESKSNP